MAIDSMPLADQAEWLAAWLRRAPAQDAGTKEFLMRAADTIERLQKERDEARNEAHAWSQGALKQVGEALAQRDAALAEIETAKAVENTLSWKIGDLQSSITRLEVSHNQLVQAAIKPPASD